MGDAKKPVLYSLMGLVLAFMILMAICGSGSCCDDMCELNKVCPCFTMCTDGNNCTDCIMPPEFNILGYFACVLTCAALATQSGVMGKMKGRKLLKRKFSKK